MSAEKRDCLLPIEGHFYRFETDDGLEHFGQYEGQMVEPCYSLVPQFRIDRMVFSFIECRSSANFSMIGYPNLPHIIEDLGTDHSIAERCSLQVI